ncbi:MAG: permease-like cell division protein FtsX [Candidatus Margulisiibacteriota bacterium]
MFRNLEFFIIEAFTSFRRSGLMSMIAVGIVMVSLTIFGLFLILILNLGNIIGEISAKMDVSVYIQDELTPKEASAIQIQLSAIPGVHKVMYVTKEEAWKDFVKKYGNRFSLEDVLDDNPLPNTFNVQVDSTDLVEKVARQASKFDKVTDVRYSGTYLESTKMLVEAVRIGGLVLVLLLTVATLLIVVNTIRLTVLARETEISIMRLVGATNTYIRGPFIIEGILIGALGGVFSILILKVSYDAISARLSSALPFLPVVTNPRQLSLVYFMVAFLGMLLGMLGGYISVSKLLKEK